MGMWGIWENWGSWQIDQFFFTIVVSAIIQRAILYATVKSLYFKSPITHTKTDIASSINKGSIQNTLWDIAVSYTWVYVTGKE